MTETKQDIQPGGILTAEKLRHIAKWLDTYDKMAIKYADLGVATGTMTLDKADSLKLSCSGTGIQDDLRRWADELDAIVKIVDASFKIVKPEG